MRALHGQRGSARDLLGGQPLSQTQRQPPHTALRQEQRDALLRRHSSGRSEDAWKRRPRKGWVCEQQQHSGEIQLFQQPIDSISSQLSSPSQVGRLAAASSPSSSSNSKPSPASSLQCRTGLPTQGDMIVSGTVDEFAGLAVAERPDTSRNSDVDYLAVGLLPTPLLFLLAP